MLDKMKQLYQMKKMLDGITSTEDYKGIKITVNGAMKILSVQISDQARTSNDLEKNILKSINNAMTNVQKRMQKEMKAGDLKMPF
ncbi:MAG: YbaB/EbfC family nucleoid-associated protein [Candidatus Moranbacteria bacterium]|jgi:DNA-binding protein YbaB|nr:YbaB/EbfC family nucleoid-associated protein [Candidatus Moranbacteria bacterium]